MKCKNILTISVLALAILTVNGLVALTGGPVTKFPLSTKLGSAQQNSGNPAYAACTGKHLKEACSFSPEANPSQKPIQAPPSSLIRNPQDSSNIEITSAVSAPTRTVQPSNQVNGECTIDPTDEVGGDSGLKCIAPTKPQAPTQAPAQDPAVAACQNKKANDACRLVITGGGVIKDAQGRVIGGTAEGLSPITASGTCVAAGNNQLKCEMAPGKIIPL